MYVMISLNALCLWFGYTPWGITIQTIIIFIYINIYFLLGIPQVKWGWSQQLREYILSLLLGYILFSISFCISVAQQMESNASSCVLIFFCARFPPPAFIKKFKWWVIKSLAFVLPYFKLQFHSLIKIKTKVWCLTKRNQLLEAKKDKQIYLQFFIHGKV